MAGLAFVSDRTAGDMLAEYFDRVETDDDITFALRVWTDPPIDRERLSNAWAEVLASNPHTAKWGEKIRLSIDSGDARIEFGFHHAAIDGIGAGHLVSAALALYAGHLKNKPVGPSSSSRPIPKSRGDGPAGSSSAGSLPAGSLSAESLSAASPAPSNRVGPAAVWSHLRATLAGHNASLVTHRRAEVPPAERLDQPIDSRWQRFADDEVLSVKLSIDVGNRLARRCRGNRTPINDVAVAAAMSAAAAMITPARGRHINIVNPVNLRLPSQRRRVANTIGLAMVRRTHLSDMSIGPLIDDVSKQLSYVRKHRVAAEIESGLAITRSVPGVWRWVRRRGWFRPTMMVTSMASFAAGRRNGLAGGGVNLVDSTIIPTLGGGCELSMAMWRIGRQTSFSLRMSPPRSMSPPAVDEFRQVVETMATRIAGNLSRYACEESTASPDTLS